MTERRAGARRSERARLPYWVLGVALGLTAVGTTYVAMSVAARDRLRFEAAVRRAEGRLNARLTTYTAMLRATDGLFAARYPVRPDEFKTYAGRLDLRRNYPGVFGIGFAVRLSHKEQAYFETFMRKAMLVKDFAVSPATSPEDDRSSIVYLEPLDERNGKAIGYDMYTDPVRRAAMRRARDEGVAAASGRVVLVQDKGDPQPTTGFLIYLPVYEGGAVPGTVEGRRKALRGWVYSPFRSTDLFGDVFAEEMDSGLEVRIYDGEAQEAGQLLFRTSDTDVNPAGEGLESVREIEVAGRPWTVVMAAGPGFYRGPAKYLPLIALLSGLGLSGGLFGLVRGQVRARLRAERVSDELRESQEALRRSEGKFRRLTDSNLIGVAFARFSGEVVDGNDAFFRMVGYTREQAGRGEVRWDRMTPAEYLGLDERAAGQLRERGVCEPYEKEFVRADGTRVPVMVGVAMLEGSGREETVGFAVDLTEIKRAQRAMQEAKEAAEAANRLKDEFLATVSHELRTPLNAILGWAQLLTGEGATAEDLSLGLGTILRNARAQAQLIEDLLDISRIVSGKLRLEARAVDLAGVVQAAVGSVGLAAEAKGVRLVAELGDGPAVAWGDPDRLQQVVWNLLANAIKFTERGGEIRVGLGLEGGEARVVVRDTGIGIEPEFLPYVFERFRQADGSVTRKHGGLGLGLSIVRSIVEMHGGTVGVESDGVGRGATFTVSLPVRADGLAVQRGDGLPQKIEENGAAQAEVVSLEGVRVLVVDDDPDARELVRHMLAARRAEVVTAGSASRALEVLRSRPVDVLVSDLAMPEEDGFALVRMVRELPERMGGRVPAVAVSALVREEERQRALAAGYQVHVPKPVEAGVLTAAVAKLRAGAGGAFGAGR